MRDRIRISIINHCKSTYQCSSSRRGPLVGRRETLRRHISRRPMSPASAFRSSLRSQPKPCNNLLPILSIQSKSIHKKLPGRRVNNIPLQIFFTLFMVVHKCMDFQRTPCEESVREVLHYIYLCRQAVMLALLGMLGRGYRLLP